MSGRKWRILIQIRFVHWMTHFQVGLFNSVPAFFLYICFYVRANSSYQTFYNTTYYNFPLFCFYAHNAIKHFFIGAAAVDNVALF